MPAPASLVSSLTRQWARHYPASILPFSSSTSAGTVAATVRSASFTGVALVNPRTGAVVRKLDAFAKPATYQAGGAYDGRYAVWKEYRSLSGLDDFVVKSWSAATGKVSVIGQAKHGPGGFMPSPWEDPALVGSQAFWVQGTSPSGAGRVVEVNLASGSSRVLRHGHPGSFFGAGSTALWAESPKPNTPTTVRAASLATGRTTPVPAVLAKVAGAWGFGADQTGYAWFGGSQSNQVFYAAANGSRYVAATIHPGGFSPPLAVTDGVVVAPISAGGVVLLDGRTGSWTVIPQASSASVAGGTLLVQQENTAKAAAPTSAAAVLDPAKVRLPGC